MTLSENTKFTLDQQNSAGGDGCRNILIKGDNKAVLKELVPVYGGMIKCIYIDPPYNNGDSYHYYNDNSSTAAWLEDIRNVLSWLRVLLKKDGKMRDRVPRRCRYGRRAYGQMSFVCGGGARCLNSKI